MDDLVKKFGNLETKKNLQDLYGSNYRYYLQYMFDNGFPNAKYDNSYIRPMGKCHEDYDTYLLGTNDPRGLKLCILSDSNKLKENIENVNGRFHTNNLYTINNLYGNKYYDFNKNQIFNGTGI